MSKITVADYLIQELSKLGIKDIFGLPGDYNFNILYAIDDNPETNWIGCTNELNAGYAADGYARINGYGALVTTFGVGELSAMNAIAGSFAENIPVIHIVGSPKTKFIEKNALIHHNFLNPDYYAFERAFSNVTETTAFLNAENAKSEIDRILTVFVNTNRPVYVSIPVDICKVEIENHPKIERNKSDAEILDKAVEHALRLIENSKKPVILGDVLVKRFKARSEFAKFLEKTQFPVSNLLMGKGLIEAENKMYLGTFLSQYENLLAYDALNESDCLISVGVINSDLNTYRLGLPCVPADHIEIQGQYTIVENTRYDNILMKDVLTLLTEKVQARNIVIGEKKPSFDKSAEPDDTKLSINYIFPRLQEFLQPNDIVFVETGILPHGFAPVRLPKNTEVNTQTLWGSIGWATPAGFGAQVAAKDRRAIIITGEGSHQLTVQEISTVMRQGLRPIYIVLNNAGYTIERVLSDDPWDFFNEISNWDYSKLPSIFEGEAWVTQARTTKELDEALKQAETEQKSKMCYIEMFTEKMDIPRITQRIVDSMKKNGNNNLVNK